MTIANVIIALTDSGVPIGEMNTSGYYPLRVDGGNLGYLLPNGRLYPRLAANISLTALEEAGILTIAGNSPKGGSGYAGYYIQLKDRSPEQLAVVASELVKTKKVEKAAGVKRDKPAAAAQPAVHPDFAGWALDLFIDGHIEEPEYLDCGCSKATAVNLYKAGIITREDYLKYFG